MKWLFSLISRLVCPSVFVHVSTCRTSSLCPSHQIHHPVSAGSSDRRRAVSRRSAASVPPRWGRPLEERPLTSVTHCNPTKGLWRLMFKVEAPLHWSELKLSDWVTPAQREISDDGFTNRTWRPLHRNKSLWTISFHFYFIFVMYVNANVYMDHKRCSLYNRILCFSPLHLAASYLLTKH